jgi:hypothetical protein
MMDDDEYEILREETLEHLGECDENVQELIRLLVEDLGQVTYESCGGHDRTGGLFGREPKGHWRVGMYLEGDLDGLGVLAWGVEQAERSGMTVSLSVGARSPIEPVCMLRGEGEPDTFAQTLRDARRDVERQYVVLRKMRADQEYQEMLGAGADDLEERT